MFEYVDIEFKGKKFGSYDLIQYDIEENLPIFLSKRSEQIKNIIVVGAWQGDEIKSFLKYTNAEVFAFEANPKIFNILKKIYEKESRVHCYNLACSSTNGKAIFFETTAEGNGSLLEVSENHPIAKKAETFEVNTIQLDYVEELKNREIDLLWVDVQGAELEVLKGATNILKNTEALFLEVSIDGRSYKGSAKLSDLNSFVDNFGFKQVAQGLNKKELDGNALFLKKDSECLKEDLINVRMQKILEMRLKKRKMYDSLFFRIAHKVVPQKLRTAIKKHVEKII